MRRLLREVVIFMLLGVVVVGLAAALYFGNALAFLGGLFYGWIFGLFVWVFYAGIRFAVNG